MGRHRGTFNPYYEVSRDSLKSNVLYGSNSVTFCKRLSCVGSETGDCQDLLRRRDDKESRRRAELVCVIIQAPVVICRASLTAFQPYINDGL